MEFIDGYLTSRKFEVSSWQPLTREVDVSMQPRDPEPRDQRHLRTLREVVVVLAFVTVCCNERHAFGLQCNFVCLVAERD